MSDRHECMHPCPSCARHVRSFETACPFCEAALPGTCVLPDPAPLGRVASRAAITFFAAAAIAACGKTSTVNDPQPQITKHGPPPMVMEPPAAAEIDFDDVLVNEGVDDETRGALAAQRREHGRTEHASVAAFARLTLPDAARARTLSRAHRRARRARGRLAHRRRAPRRRLCAHRREARATRGRCVDPRHPQADRRRRRTSLRTRMGRRQVLPRRGRRAGRARPRERSAGRARRDGDAAPRGRRRRADGSAGASWAPRSRQPSTRRRGPRSCVASTTCSQATA